jgi:acyl carrier protein
MLTPETDFMPGTSESSILSRVRHFVEENSFYRQHGFALTEDERFLERTVADSRYFDEMITFIEDEFGVHVSNCEITEDNLGSLRAVVRFVVSKQPYAVG